MSETRVRNWWVALGWSGWALLLACWTAALLSREAPKVSAALIPQDLHFWVAKGVHLSTYAVLAFAACWLPASWRLRAVIWVALLAHAALTEWGQTFVEGRTGTVRDVAINATGILLGITAGLTLQRFFARGEASRER